MSMKQPCVVRFDSTSCKAAVVSPYFHGDGSSSSSFHETDHMAVLQGKQCIGRHEDWLLMLDDLTRECFLMMMSLDNSSPSSSPPPTVTKISLPPLLDRPRPDLPRPDLAFGCALSTTHENTTPDHRTVVMLGIAGEKSLLYCHPGDREWSRLPVQLHHDDDIFFGPIVLGYHGKMYATTMRAMVVVDASAPSTPAVERADVRLPDKCPVHGRYEDYMVPSRGDIFWVRCCFFGVICPTEMVHLQVFRWNPESSRDAWETIHGVGYRTFFLSRFSFASEAAAEIQPNCIHVLRRVCDGIGIYTVSLDDMTSRLSILEGCCDDDDDDYAVFWASFGLKPSGITDTSDVSNEVNQRTEHCCKEEEEDMSIAHPAHGRQWCDLQTDLLQLLVTKISFIDVLHLKAVCKHWNSSIASPNQAGAKVLPLLMTSRPGRKDLLDVFDLVSEKKYSMRVNIPEPEDGTGTGSSQLLHFTKNGWVIVSRGAHSFFIVNPFKAACSSPDDVIALPPLLVSCFGLKVLSFSSVPGSPDFVVVTAEGYPNGQVVWFKTWRVGDKDWREETFVDDDVPFRLASHSPVFLDGVFYFLDINGRLGVLDPTEEEMEWTVLDEPAAPIRGDDDVYPDEFNYTYLVEWKRELIALVREGASDDESIRVFKLDRSRMVWSELDGVEDAVLFWSRNNALAAMPPPGEEDFYCNKMFLPNYTETDHGSRAQAFYSLGEQRYYPSFYAKEPMNAVWFHPNLDCFQ